MRVGNNTLVKKSVAEATKLVEDQIKEMQEAIKQLDSNFKQAALHAQSLEQEIMTLQAKNK